MSTVEKYKFQPAVTPETEKAIREYAAVMGMKANTAVAQLLEASAPGLVELTEAMRMANQSPARALREMAKAIHKASADADQIALDLTPTATRRKKKTGS